MPARFIGMKNPELKMQKVQDQADKGGNTLLYSLAKDSLVELKQNTPVDTEKMLKSWKKTPLVVKKKDKVIGVYNNATNKRTGYLYPLALEYGFHHYAWGNYLGFRAGLFFRERTIAKANNELTTYISVFNRGCMRVWK